MSNDSSNKSYNKNLVETYSKILDDILDGKIANYNFNIQSYEKVKNSVFFDEDYYLSTYNIHIPNEFAFIHYLNQGFKEGKNPSSIFNGNKYLKDNADVKKSGLNPLVHYELYGKKEKRKFPYFKELDVIYSKIFEDISEGKLEKYNFNIQSYNKVKDSELFDEEYYLVNYDIPISKPFAFIHYLNEGFKEGFNPSEIFDGNKYIGLYNDVKRANVNPLVHYELYGKKEGREFPFSTLFVIQNSIDDLNVEIQSNRINQNVFSLQNKVRSGKKVNVVFVLPAMMFVYRKLYYLFENDDLFNVSIVLVPHRIGDNEDVTDVAKDKYYQILSYLEEEGFNVISGYDFEDNKGIDLVLECNPDLVFYVLPYMRIYPKNMKIDNLPSNILFAYIPYGEFLEDDLEDNLYNFGWNDKIWKIFCSTKEYYYNASEKSKVGSSNVIVSGSARMDSLINFEPSENDYEWIYPKEENKKRIIWSPHHTLSRPSMDEKTAYSTFDKNYNFFYEYAKNNPDIEWVLRPHPLLKEIISKIDTYMKRDGIATDGFIEDYFFKWNSLPNARVHEELDYTDLFANADAMITDCVSFKAEYLYADKPGLILKKDQISYEGYKGKVTDAWYIANGSDFDEISKFIEDVVINENDELKEQREEIFNQYFNINLGKASEFIFNYIKDELSLLK